MKAIFTIGLFILGLAPVLGQGILYLTTADGSLYRVNPLSCEAVLLGNNSAIFFDLGFDPVSGELYGVDFTNDYHRIDLSDASSQVLGNLNLAGYDFVNAMTFDEFGEPYAHSSPFDILHYMDRKNGEASPSISTGLGIGSSGDLTIYQSEMYLAGGPNWLVKINTIDPTQSEVIGEFSTLANVFGVTSHRCGGLFLAFSDNDIYVQNSNNLLESTLLCNDIVDQIIYGAASTTESVLSNADETVYIGDQIMCNNEAFEIDATRFNSTYTWSNGSTEPIVTIEEPGDYTVSIVDECGPFNESFEVTSEFTPSVNLGNDTIICEGETLILDATLINADSYTWQDGSTSPTFEVFSTGVYEVTLENVCGMSTSSIEVTFVYCTNTQEENLSHLIKIYPTITEDLFHIDLKEISTATLEIVNTLGQRMSSADISLGRNTLSLKDFSSGIYVVNVLINGKNIHVEKIVKE